MAIDPQSQNPQARAALALHRFGFGPRAGDIAAIASDPRSALLADLAPGAGQIGNLELMDSAQALRAVFEFRQEKKADRLARQMMNATGAGDMVKGDMANGGMAKDVAADKPGPPLPQRIYLAEAKAHYDAALDADVGFAERLVWFWSNHFCVSADKGPTRPICGAYEREAIRPHVLGKFSDMLLAVETHPAMLLYLDNVALDRPRLVCRHKTRQGHQREPGARDPGTAYARRAHRLYAGRRHQFRQGDHRLDHSCRRAIRSAAASSCSIRACTSRARRR